MSLPANPASREPYQARVGQGWLTSLVFWLCLFTAAALYGTVTLSPKLLAFLVLDR